LKALVGGLGLLVVLGTALVIGVIIKRIYANPAVPSTASAMPVQGSIPPLTDTLELPAGAKIVGIAAADGVFAVAVSSPKGEQVWIMNPQTGARFVTMSAPK